MTEDVDKVLQDFYKKLVESQEELPADFRKVLDEHFWELYDE